MQGDDARHELELAVRRHFAPKIGFEEGFPLDDFTVYRLVNGFDDIGLTLRNEDAITAFERTRPAWAPVTTA